MLYWPRGGGRGGEIALLFRRFQASPARPSDRSIMEKIMCEEDAKHVVSGNFIFSRFLAYFSRSPPNENCQNYCPCFIVKDS